MSFIRFGIDFKLMFWGFVVRFFVDGIDICKLLGRFRRLPVCRFRELSSRVGAGVPLCFSSSSRDSGVAFRTSSCCHVARRIGGEL